MPMVPSRFHPGASAAEENPFSALDLGAEVAEFLEWARRRYRETSLRKEVLYYVKYVELLREPIRLSYTVAGMGQSTKLHVLKVLRVFARFLDAKYNTNAFTAYLDRVRRLAGLKWSRARPLPTLRRLAVDVEELVRKAIPLVPNPKYRLFCVFMLGTGLRTSEAYTAFREFPRFYTTLDGIHVLELMMDRGTKKAFFTFVTPRLADAVTSLKDRRLSIRKVQVEWGNAVERLGASRYEYPLYTLRKLNATLLKRVMSESDVDLLQGRVPRSILAQYYNVEGLRHLYKLYMESVGKLVDELLHSIGMLSSP